MNFRLLCNRKRRDSKRQVIWGAALSEVRPDFRTTLQKYVLVLALLSENKYSFCDRKHKRLGMMHTTRGLSTHENHWSLVSLVSLVWARQRDEEEKRKRMEEWRNSGRPLVYVTSVRYNVHGERSRR